MGALQSAKYGLESKLSNKEEITALIHPSSDLAFLGFSEFIFSQKLDPKSILQF